MGGPVREGGREGGRERAREGELDRALMFLKEGEREGGMRGEESGTKPRCEAQQGTTSVFQMWPPQLTDTKRNKEERGF